MTVDTTEYTKLMKRVFRFRSLANARSFSDGAAKLHLILRGDADEDGECFWVAVPAATEKLHRAGYEYVG